MDTYKTEELIEIDVEGLESAMNDYDEIQDFPLSEETEG